MALTVVILFLFISLSCFSFLCLFQKMTQSRRCQQLEQKEARSCKNLFSKRMGKQKSLFIFLIITTTLSLSDVNCENGDLQNTGNKWKCFYCLYSCQEYILDFGTVWISIEGRKHVCWEEHIPSPSLLMLNATVQTSWPLCFLVLCWDRSRAQARNNKG